MSTPCSFFHVPRSECRGTSTSLSRSTPSGGNSEGRTSGAGTVAGAGAGDGEGLTEALSADGTAAGSTGAGMKLDALKSLSVTVALVGMSCFAVLFVWPLPGDVGSVSNFVVAFVTGCRCAPRMANMASAPPTRAVTTSSATRMGFLGTSTVITAQCSRNSITD